jgi:hypothetical protein
MQRDRHLASGDLCRESAPLGQGSRASLLVDLPRDEMALLIELVVHLGMTELNFCSVFGLRKRCIARSRRRNG